ncbi:MAG: CocE/NonD family hydrolase [Myxococcota bacterium]
MRYLCSVLAAAACGGATASSPGRPSPPPIPPGTSLEPLIATPPADKSQYAAAIVANYTKYDVRIPMRDGKRLYTTFYVPKDRGQTYPILLMRTPYSEKPYGPDHYPNAAEPRTLRNFAPSRAVVRDGFIIVHQDVRGRMMSEGEFVDVRPVQSGEGVDETTDAYDTVEWLLNNVPHHNGRVGVWGISYPGFYAAQAAISGHPAIKAVSPQAPVTDWFIGDDFHHNGAFFLADAFSFYSRFGRPRPKPTPVADWRFDYYSGDAYSFYLQAGPLSNINRRYLKGAFPFGMT